MIRNTNTLSKTRAELALYLRRRWPALTFVIIEINAQLHVKLVRTDRG